MSKIYMKRIMNSLLAAAAILTVGCSTLHKSDFSALQGTWKGYEASHPANATAHITFSGNTLDYQGVNANDRCKGTFTLREDTNPKQLVGVLTDCPETQYVGKTVHAIYKLEAGTLTLTGNEPGNPAVPTSFEEADARKFVFKKP
jgi:uncharacterized protein (TIGR03067 family)